MFDYINGEKVQCFYIPIFSSSKATGGYIYYSGGVSTTFNIGDEIPITTAWYKYPKDFMILDSNNSIENALIHIIENACVLKTIRFKEMDESFFKNNRAIYDCKGRELNISSLSDMKSFLGDRRTCDLENESKSINKQLIHNLEVDISNDIKVIKQTSRVQYILESINDDDFNEINLFMKKYENLEFETKNGLKEYINGNYEIDSFVVSKIRWIIVKRLTDDFDLITTLYGEENNIQRESMRASMSLFYQKWYKKDKYKNIKKLGEYIDCMSFILDNMDNDTFSIINYKEDYGFCLKNIKELLSLEDDLVSKYIDWLDVSSEKKSKIESVIFKILK